MPYYVDIDCGGRQAALTILSQELYSHNGIVINWRCVLAGTELHRYNDESAVNIDSRRYRRCLIMITLNVIGGQNALTLITGIANWNSYR